MSEGLEQPDLDGQVPGAELPGDPGEAGRPDDATIRAELRERGHDPPQRARLGKEWVQLWLSGEAATDPGDDPGETVTAAAPPPPAEPGTGKPPRTGTGERAPRRPKPSGSLRERLWGPQSGAKKGKARGAGKDKPKHDRVSIESLCATIWAGAGNALSNVDPALSRCLVYEADMAGMVCEDTLRGTIVDKVLQPAARAEGKARTIGALVALPGLVVMIQQADAMAEPQRTIRLAVLIPMARRTAAQLLLSTGEQMRERMAREAEFGATQAEVDDLLDVIFYGSAPAEPEPAAGPEDQAAAHAQQAATPGGFMFTAPPPPPPPPPAYAHPYEPPPARRVIPGTVVRL